MSEEKKTTVPPSPEQKDLATRIAQLESDNEKLRGNVQTWQGKATDYEKRYAGIDLDKIKADSQALEQLMKEKAKTDEKTLADLEKRYEEKYSKEYKTKLDELEGKTKSQGAKIRELTVGRTMIEKCQPLQAGASEFLKPYFDMFCDLDDQGEIIIKNDKGEARRSPNDPTKNMTPDEYISEMTAKYQWLLPSSVRKGDLPAGHKSNGSPAGLDMAAWNRMTKEEKMKVEPALRQKFATESLKQ